MYAAPAKLHFQFASNDEWVQTLEQVDLYRAASQPKSRQMFEADELLNDEAKKDRHAWLRRVLLGKRQLLVKPHQIGLVSIFADKSTLAKIRCRAHRQCGFHE